MGILEDFGSQPAQPSLEDKKDFFRNSIIDGSKGLLKQIIEHRNALYNYFWYKYPDLTIEQKLEALDTEAVSLFTEDFALKAFVTSRLKNAGLSDEEVEAIVPGVPPEYVATPHQDGTLTVTLKEDAEEEDED